MSDISIPDDECFATPTGTTTIPTPPSIQSSLLEEQQSTYAKNQSPPHTLKLHNKIRQTISPIFPPLLLDEGKKTNYHSLSNNNSTKTNNQLDLDDPQKNLLMKIP